MSDGLTQPEYLRRFAKNGTDYDREVLAQAVTSLLQTNLSAKDRAVAEEILSHLRNPSQQN